MNILEWSHFSFWADNGPGNWTVEYSFKTPHKLYAAANLSVVQAVPSLSYNDGSGESFPVVTGAYISCGIFLYVTKESSGEKAHTFGLPGAPSVLADNVVNVGFYYAADYAQGACNFLILGDL